MRRDTPLEIKEILETYEEEATTRDDAAGEAEAEALARLDAVAMKIDPEHDQAHDTLLEAARARVRSRTS